MEKRKITYYLENAGDFNTLEENVKKIKGVLFAAVDKKSCVLTYEIDDLASDYDVFAEVCEIVEKTNCVIDFAKSDEESAKALSADLNENSQAQNLQKQNSQTQKTQVKSPQAEKSQAQKSENSDSDYGDDENENSTPRAKKPKRSLSEAVQSAICLAAGLVCLILGHILSLESAKTVTLAVAFALSGYELIYEIASDVLSGRVLTFRFIAALGVVGALFLGYAEQAIAATLMIAALSLLASVLKRRALKDTPAEPSCDFVTLLITKNGKEREKEVCVCDVKSGDVLCVSKNENCRFGGALASPFSTALRKIQGENGEEYSEVELKKGDEVKKGDVLLSSSRVKVSVGFGDELSAFEREFVSRTREKSALNAKLQKNRVKICAIALGVLLLAAFVPPIFYEEYSIGLYRWGAFSAICAVIFGGGALLIAYDLAGIASLSLGYKKGIISFGQDESLFAAGCELVALDKENALDDKNGELKADCLGALHEFRDCGKRLALLTLLSEDKAAELCKNLKIHEYYCFNTEEEKLQKIKELSSQNALCVCSDFSLGRVIALNCENLSNSENVENNESAENGENSESGESGENSAALISGDEIAYAPYVYKTAKRAAWVKRFGLWFDGAVKVVIAALAAAGIASLWWAVLADVVACGICLCVAFSAGKEIY